MPEKLEWRVSATVEKGPSVADTGTVPVHGYDKFTVAIPKKEGGTVKSVKVDLVSEDAADLVRALILKPTKKDGSVTFSVNKAESSAAKRTKLDGVLVLVGGGAVSLLHEDGPAWLQVYNQGDEDVLVEVLVARDFDDPA